MMNLNTYGYIETTPTAEGLMPGRVTELRRERREQYVSQQQEHQYVGKRKGGVRR